MRRQRDERLDARDDAAGIRVLLETMREALDHGADGDRRDAERNGGVGVRRSASAGTMTAVPGLRKWAATATVGRTGTDPDYAKLERAQTTRGLSSLVGHTSPITASSHSSAAAAWAPSTAPTTSSSTATSL